MEAHFVWQKNLLHAMRTHDAIILHGNIRDIYLYRDPPQLYEASFNELITRLLFPLYGPLYKYDPYSKASTMTLGPAQVFLNPEEPQFGSPGFNVTIDPTVARILSHMQSSDQRSIWMLQYMHNLLPYRSSYSQEESLRMVAFQSMIENIAPGNKLLLCYLSDTQVPVELSRNIHRVAFVKVPMPDFEERLTFWERELEPALAKEMAKLSDGMAMTSLKQLTTLAEEQAQQKGSNVLTLSMRDWERIIGLYKFGESQNPYRQITVERLEKAKSFFVNEERIKGQDNAVNKAILMLWKARTNISALLRSGPSTSPRGTLFLCGPSGTGKTMLSKKIAKFVFGSEDAFHRIDMSEYQQDHTVSKLIGSPPGYVGYEVGGILTNAMLEKPFSVVLFDEIEKAHPRILDLFLQILSDGRLTDSRGQTVFFSEAIIIFTSNLGAGQEESAQLEEARQSGDPKQVHEHFVRSVQKYFHYTIGRPELLNRIGSNIIPFNFLNQEELQSEMVKSYLADLGERFNQEYIDRKVQIEIQLDEVTNLIVEKYGVVISEFGGRGVLNTLEDAVLPLLAQRVLLLELKPAKGPTVMRLEVDQAKKKLIVRT